MEKKISFGFTKVSKKPAIISQKQQKEERKLELIDCLEGQAIKIKDAVEEEINSPLNIPIKDNARSLLDRIKDATAKQSDARKKENNTTDVIDDRPDSELTLDELAARELIKEAKARLENKNLGVEKVHELPLVEEKPILDGAEVPTLKDYEDVPVGDYGMAMLRGMGWKEGTGIGKNAKIVEMGQPECRPKGLGLGASKLVAEKMKTVLNKDGKELMLEPKAFAKIIVGHHKDQYCQVQGLDDENALVIVKTAIKGDILKLNDIFLIPVTKEEYDMCSRVLNNKKYEEYKEISDRNLENQRQEGNANNTVSSDSEADTKTSRSSKDRYSNQNSSGHSASKTNTNDTRSSFRQRSSSEDSEDQTDSSHSSGSLKQHRNGSKYYRKKSQQSTTSESDSADSRYGESSKNHPKSRRDKKDSRSESSISKGSKKHRRHDRDGHRSRSSSSESDREENRRRKNKNKSRYRSRSSSSESGYERNRRRKNKTKSRHRRYSNEESEESYKKNRKHKK